MADQTLLIAGPSASAFCYGLVDTGKFVRIYPEKRIHRRSGLFGASVDDEGDYSDTDNPDDDLESAKNQTQGKKTKVDPQRGHDSSNGELRRIHGRSPYFNAPASDKSYDYAVRGNQSAVSAVMEIVREHRREFETTETETNFIRVNCVGSPDKTQVALHEIRKRL